MRESQLELHMRDSPRLRSSSGGGGYTWYTEEGLAVEVVRATLPVDLTQVVAGTRVGVTRVGDLPSGAVGQGAGVWIV